MNDEQRDKELTVFSHEAELALVGYQMVEQSLKSYIIFAHDCIREALDKKLPFRYTEDKVDSYSMERLITTFKKLNDNEDLLARLNKLPSDRNYVAHKAFANAYYKISIDKQSLVTDIEKVKGMRDFVWKCFQEIGIIENGIHTL